MNEQKHSIVLNKNQFSQLSKHEQLELLKMESLYSLYLFFNGQANTQEAIISLSSWNTILRDKHLIGTDNKEPLKDPQKFFLAAKRLLKKLTGETIDKKNLIKEQ